MVQTSSAIFFATAALIAATPALGAAIPKDTQPAGLKHTSTTRVVTSASSAHTAGAGIHGAVEHSGQFSILKDNNNIQKDKNRLNALEHELHSTEHDLHHNEFDLHRTEGAHGAHQLGNNRLAEDTRGSKNLGAQRGRLSPEHDLHNLDHHSAGAARPSSVRGAKDTRPSGIQHEHDLHNLDHLSTGAAKPSGIRGAKDTRPSGTTRKTTNDLVHGQNKLAHGTNTQGPHASHTGSGSRYTGAPRPTGTGKARLTNGRVDLGHEARPSGAHPTHTGSARPTGTSRSNLPYQKDSHLLHDNTKPQSAHASHTGSHTSAARPTGTTLLGHNHLAHAPAASSARPSSHTLAAAAAKATATHKSKSKIQQEIDDLYTLDGRALDGSEHHHHRVHQSHQSFHGNGHSHEHDHEHQHEPMEGAADAEPRSEDGYEFDARSLEEFSDLMARSYFDFYDELD